MKKINYLWLFGLLSVMALGFVSCSDDDDKGPGSSSELVGTWQLVSGYYLEKENGKIISEENEGTSVQRMVFTAEGDYSSYVNGRLSDDGTWSYKGGKIAITFDDEGDVYTDYLTVLDLTETSLTVEYSYKEKEGGYTYEGYSKETFRKVTN